jgi:hypothetical protein
MQGRLGLVLTTCKRGSHGAGGNPMGRASGLGREDRLRQACTQVRLPDDRPGAHRPVRHPTASSQVPPRAVWVACAAARFPSTLKEDVAQPLTGMYGVWCVQRGEADGNARSSATAPRGILRSPVRRVCVAVPAGSPAPPLALSFTHSLIRLPSLPAPPPSLAHG